MERGRLWRTSAPATLGSASVRWKPSFQRNHLPASKRVALANDPLNLLAVDAAANRQKGDGDAATWLPPRKAYRCAYVARQVAVKAKYGLWVTAAERDAISRVLGSCPGQRIPTGGNPTTAPIKVSEATASRTTTREHDHHDRSRRQHQLRELHRSPRRGGYPAAPRLPRLLQQTRPRRRRHRLRIAPRSGRRDGARCAGSGHPPTLASLVSSLRPAGPDQVPLSPRRVRKKSASVQRLPTPAIGKDAGQANKANATHDSPLSVGTFPWYF